jgi:hypothetical protein
MMPRGEIFVRLAVVFMSVLVLVSAASAAEWAPGVFYSVGTNVTYQGPTYRCLQAHTSQVGWEPPNVPALWSLPSGTPAPTPTTRPRATATSRATATATARSRATATATIRARATATATARPRATATATPTSGGSTVNVSTAAQLSAALSAAAPGQTIVLASGTYVGTFKLLRSGTSSQRLTITGPGSAVLQGTSLGGGYGLHLDHVSYVTVRGITITGSQKGIITDGAHHSVIDGVWVHDVGMEAIHLRSFSTDNVVQNCRVTSTGRVNAGFGEGLYVGSANSNWGTYSGGQPDASNNNKLLNNTLGPHITGEPIDIKEGTTGGEIRGNRFDSTGISGEHFADSWIDVKGNGWLVTGNTGTNPSGSPLLDGIQVHRALTGWGNNNTFTSNDLTVNAPGYGFSVQSGLTGTVISSNNIVRGAAKGVANIPLQ